MNRFPSLALPLLLILAAAPSAHALESAPITTPHAEVSLASDVDAVEPGKPFRLGLHFKLAKGWHIYWSNPGSAGEPPQVDLDLPAGAKAAAIDFPAPERVPEGPVMTYSYLDEVLLPFTVTTPSSLAKLPIDAKVSWLICEKICVPEEGKLHLDMPVGTPSPSPQAPLFQAADRRIPHPSTLAATLAGDGTLSLRGEGLSPVNVREAWFLPSAWGAIDDMAAQPLHVEDGGLSLKLKPGKTFDPKAELSGVLVTKDATGAESFQTIAAKPDGAALASRSPVTPPVTKEAAKAIVMPDRAIAEDTGLLSLLGFAFIGGLILNLMPCVFPILAMKAASIAGLAGHQRTAIRAHAASYTLGILAAFAALAAVLLVLRSAGLAVGWGFQFQSPAFVAVTAWLLLAVGLNLSGVFELSGGFVGAGQELTTRGGHVGSFFTGLLAVLVATPCTAPFMGAAVAAALAAPAAVTFMIFLVMGLGLAAPYALLGIFPRAARLLPKPGRWMQLFKQALAFPMYGAVAWLIWVIGQQSGSDGLMIVLSGGVLIGFAAWLFGATRHGGSRERFIGSAASAIATIGALALLLNIAAATPAALPTAEAETPYSATRLADLRAEGRPVFVNMTPAWCVTCLVNERIALSSAAVKEAFARRNVAYLKGDWTRADPSISKYLQEHGRDGVPLYVFYPPTGKPVVLPQVLTEKIVLDEIDRLGS